MSTSPTSPSRGTSAATVRRQFLEFFGERDHRVVPSSPVFPQDDPTLLFTNAGMNQFKDVFLGTGSRDYARAADTQKCIRVSGKHNDLEEVGSDTYHHTFFEMLGNWSFGDYFKEEAISWAWKLLTEVWGVPKERLWVTVFGGDEELGLAADEDAERVWLEATDIDPSRVLRFGKRDNFWEMGETGPCGPCSEIHIDRGGENTDPADGANPEVGVNAGNERFLELWNLVFMQFNRLDDGSLQDLPAKHVDTGLGLERISAVLAGVQSNYDTDLFQPIFERLAKVTDHVYGSDERIDVAFRVCADHVRAVSTAIADGALPSNTGRGYVLRRLIRRAARFGRQELGVGEPFLHELVPTVAEILGDAFPEVRARSDHIQLIVREEEQAFSRTIGRGLVRFEELADKISRSSESVIPGDQAFELYATYGFPRDLVDLMARERGLSVDEPAWDAAEQAHQSASKSEGQFKQILTAEVLAQLDTTISTYHEDGPRSAELQTRIATWVRPPTPTEDFDIALVLEESPFYAESGGQVGDRGTIEGAGGALRVEVRDTKKEGAIVIHRGVLAASPPGGVESLGEGATVLARVDVARRDLTRKNHTATHLLHKALRLVLGEHVAQQGSYVGPDRLRFDFSHPRGMEAGEIDQVEQQVNERIAANSAVVTTVEDLEEAKARGVVAMFGEKYDARVRVLDVGGWSTELCGGTHVRAAGDIGPFVVTSEQAISAGVRRIEAVTGPEALAEIQRQRGILRQAALALKSAPRDVPARIEQLQGQVKEAKKKKAASSSADLSASFDQTCDQLEDRAGFAAGVLDLPQLDGKAIRDLADRVKGKKSDLALVLVGREEGKVPFVVIAEGRALELGLDASSLAALLRESLGGGGGGRPNRAQGQGIDASGVPAALESARAALAALS